MCVAGPFAALAKQLVVPLKPPEPPRKRPGHFPDHARSCPRPCASRTASCCSRQPDGRCLPHELHRAPVSTWPKRQSRGGRLGEAGCEVASWFSHLRILPCALTASVPRPEARRTNKPTPEKSVCPTPRCVAVPISTLLSAARNAPLVKKYDSLGKTVSNSTAPTSGAHRIASPSNVAVRV